MKTSRYILIAAVGLLIGLSNVALARPKVHVNINLGGRQGFHSGNRNNYRFSRRPRHFEPTWGWRNYRPRRQTIIIGSGCWYDQGPEYYVVAPPRVVERVPVVIERQTVVYSTSSPQIVQPQQFDESTLQLNMDLQHKK